MSTLIALITGLTISLAQVRPAPSAGDLGMDPFLGVWAGDATAVLIEPPLDLPTLRECSNYHLEIRPGKDRGWYKAKGRCESKDGAEFAGWNLDLLDLYRDEWGLAAVPCADCLISKDIRLRSIHSLYIDLDVTDFQVTTGRLSMGLRAMRLRRISL